MPGTSVCLFSKSVLYRIGIGVGKGKFYQYVFFVFQWFIVMSNL